MQLYLSNYKYYTYCKSVVVTLIHKAMHGHLLFNLLKWVLLHFPLQPRHLLRHDYRDPLVLSAQCQNNITEASGHLTINDHISPTQSHSATSVTGVNFVTRIVMNVFTAHSRVFRRVFSIDYTQLDFLCRQLRLWSWLRGTDPVLKHFTTCCLHLMRFVHCDIQVAVIIHKMVTTALYFHC